MKSKVFPRTAGRQPEQLRSAVSAVRVEQLEQRTLFGGGGQNMLLVVNPNDEASLRVAAAYQQARRIPDSNIIFIAPPASLTLPNANAFISTYQTPILNHIQSHNLSNQIDYIGLIGQPRNIPFPGASMDGQISLAYAVSQLYQYSAVLSAVPANPTQWSEWVTSPLFQGFVGSTDTYHGTGAAIHSSTVYPATLYSASTPIDSRWIVAGNISFNNVVGMLPDTAISRLTASAAADGTKPSGTIVFDDWGDTSAYGTDQSLWTAAQTVLNQRNIPWAGIRYGYVKAGTTGQGIDSLFNTTTPVRGYQTGGNGGFSNNLGLNLIPGSWASSFGSYTGANAISYVRSGASMGSGPMTEPYAFTDRFPNPAIHLQIDDGATLGEAYYRSVKTPDLQVPIGDLLAQPYADVPQVSFSGSAPAENASVSGTLNLSIAASLVAPRRATGIATLLFYVDGVLQNTIAGANGTFTLNTTTLSDGRHELRFIGINNSTSESQGYLLRNVLVNNKGESVAVTGSNFAIDPFAMASIPVTSANPSNNDGGIIRIELRSLGRVLGSINAVSGSVALDPAMLAYGNNAVTPVAVFANGTQVAGVPVTITRNTRVLSGGPVSSGTTPGMKVEYFHSKRGNSLENSDFSGKPDAIATVTNANGSNWLPTGVRMPGDGNLAMRVSGRFTAPAAGEYQFYVTSNWYSATEPLALYIDGQQIFKNPQYGTPNEQFTPSAFLGAGEHTITMLCMSRWFTGSPDLAITFRNPSVPNATLDSAVVYQVNSTLPAGWQALDIGSPTLAGSASVSGSTWTLSGAGTGLSASDQFRFASQQWMGDGQLTTQLTSLSNPDPGAAAGVMVRDGLPAGAAYAAVMRTAAGALQLQWRTASGTSGSSTPLSGFTGPVWVRVRRQGTSYSGYYSTDGVNWTLLGNAPDLGFRNDSELLGLAVTSHTAAQAATATFANPVIAYVGPRQLLGTPMGAPANGGWTPPYAANGSLTDYYSAINRPGWVGIDMGPGRTGQITQIRFAASNHPDRAVNGVFQASNDPNFATGVVTLASIGATQPPANQWITFPVSDTGQYRYMRFLADTNSQGEIAEVEFDGYATTGNGLDSPTGLAATAPFGSQANVTWTPVSGATSYRIYRWSSASQPNGGIPATPVGTSTTANFTDTGLVTGTQYYYVVQAVNGASYSGPSGQATVTTPFSGPSDLTATVINTVQINLAWTLVSGATGYNVYRGSSAGQETTLLNASPLSSTTNFYWDTNLSPGTTYWYIVKPLQGSTLGTASNEVSATTVRVADASPTQFTASIGQAISTYPVGMVQLQLQWNSFPGNNGYYFYRGTSPGGESATAINSTPVTTTIWSDTPSLAPATTYYYTCRAVVGGNLSGVSQEVSVTTAPLAPTNLTAAASGTRKITLSWTAPAGAVSYTIYRGTTSGGATVPLGGMPITTTSYTDTNLTAGTRYYYVVKALAATGGALSLASSEASDTAVVIPPAVSSVAINGGAAQRSMVTRSDVVFSTPVTLAAGAITIKLSTGAAVPNTTVTVANPSGDQKSYVLSFSGSAVVGGSLADGIYDLVVSASAVQDLTGTAMTANYSQRFHRLFGDSDGNKVVNALDYARLKNALGRAPSDPLFNSAFDYEGNNLINALDLARFRQRYGMVFSY